ncbi:hypothetical protein protein, partial [Bacillus cereus G9241]
MLSHDIGTKQSAVTNDNFISPFRGTLLYHA